MLQERASTMYYLIAISFCFFQISPTLAQAPSQNTCTPGEFWNSLISPAGCRPCNSLCSSQCTSTTRTTDCTVCTTTGTGFSNPNTGPCSQCLSGTFANNGVCQSCTSSCSKQCTTLGRTGDCQYCAPGSGLATTGGCTSCTQGSFSSAGICIPCTLSCAQTLCQLGSSTDCSGCVDPGYGFYSATGLYSDASCQLCPSTFYVKNTQCTACTTTCDASCTQGSTSDCSGCTNPGYALSIATPSAPSICTQCPKGQYANSLGQCTLCTTSCNGQCSSPGRTRDCTPCGIYSGFNGDGCSPCLSGFFSQSGICVTCNSQCMSQCITTGRSSDCVLCPGQGWNGISCTDCLPGQYSVNNLCVACSSSCASQCTTVPRSSDCIPCTVAGTGLAVGATECTTCPTYQYASLGVCVPCTATCQNQCVTPPQTSNCNLCPNSQVWQGSSCQDSPVGNYVNAGASVACDPNCVGQCTTINRNQNCEVCKAGLGYIFPLIIGAGCNACPVGSYSYQGVCVNCQDTCAGQCQQSGRSLPCATCPSPLNLYQSLCVHCPTGTYIYKGACLPCDSSCSNQCSTIDNTQNCQTCPSGTALLDGICQQCPVQSFANQGICSPCSSNCNAQCTLAGRVSDCQSCSNGNSAWNGAYCEICEVGEYVNNGICTACTLNCKDQCNSSGRGGDCQVCPAGQGFNALTQSCSICGVGTYSRSSLCVSCDSTCAGQCNQIGRSTNCGRCEDGQFWSLNQCQVCPIGTYELNGVCVLCSSICSNQCDSVGRDEDCTLCASSYGLVDQTCTLCPIGTFTNLMTCSTCSSLCGSLQCLQPGRQFDCILCDRGSFFNLTAGLCQTCTESCSTQCAGINNRTQDCQVITPTAPTEAMINTVGFFASTQYWTNLLSMSAISITPTDIHGRICGALSIAFPCLSKAGVDFTTLSNTVNDNSLLALSSTTSTIGNLGFNFDVILPVESQFVSYIMYEMILDGKSLDDSSVAQEIYQALTVLLGDPNLMLLGEGNNYDLLLFDIDAYDTNDDPTIGFVQKGNVPSKIPSWAILLIVLGCILCVYLNVWLTLHYFNSEQIAYQLVLTLVYTAMSLVPCWWVLIILGRGVASLVEIHHFKRKTCDQPMNEVPMIPNIQQMQSNIPLNVLPNSALSTVTTNMYSPGRAKFFVGD